LQLLTAIGISSNGRILVFWPLLGLILNDSESYLGLI